jgi:hypothetical protein
MFEMAPAAPMLHAQPPPLVAQSAPGASLISPPGTAGNLPVPSSAAGARKVAVLIGAAVLLLLLGGLLGYLLR